MNDISLDHLCCGGGVAQYILPTRQLAFNEVEQSIDLSAWLPALKFQLGSLTLLQEPVLRTAGQQYSPGGPAGTLSKR